MKRVFIYSLFTVILITACRNSGSGRSGEIIIFHAGSLSVPFKQLKDEYEKKNPGIKILLEPAGSLVCARKITELKKPCDIMASADYFVINELLIPEYASWSIRFATNEIVIAYNDKSKYSSEITSNNWIEILSRDDVIYARAEPDFDPCGYRTVLSFKLAEKFYDYPGLTEKLITKNRDFIRPKEVDLIALIESNAIDYMFQYKSVAIQHDLKYIDLPDEINLSNPNMNDNYNTVSLDVAGSTPGSKMTVKGDFINYSLTIPEVAANKDEALKFVGFILSNEGIEIFRKNGQEPIIPFSSEQYDKLPRQFQRYLKDTKMN
ncbi:MAG: tungstate ABC transporter substrate-binding protein WtpA [Bacteroidales bacterium]|nr:tungstate ABC transporter substrate-binding protein WtpA [Bacteroidales bacterium]